MRRVARVARLVPRKGLFGNQRPRVDAVFQRASNQATGAGASPVAGLQPATGEVLAGIAEVVCSLHQVAACAGVGRVELALGVEGAHGHVSTPTPCRVLPVVEEDPPPDGVVIRVDGGHATHATYAVPASLPGRSRQAP